MNFLISSPSSAHNLISGYGLGTQKEWKRPRVHTSVEKHCYKSAVRRSKVRLRLKQVVTMRSCHTWFLSHNYLRRCRLFSDTANISKWRITYLVYETCHIKYTLHSSISVLYWCLLYTCRSHVMRCVVAYCVLAARYATQIVIHTSKATNREFSTSPTNIQGSLAL